MKCVLSSHTYIVLCYSRITQCPLEGYEMMNDKRSVVLCLCVTLNCSHIWEKTVYTDGSLPKKWCAQIHVHRIQKENEEREKTTHFGQQQIALPVARRNIIYATNRDILFIVLLFRRYSKSKPLSNLTRFVSAFFFFFHWQFPIRFHSPVRRKFTLERIKKSNGEYNCNNA